MFAFRSTTRLNLFVLSSHLFSDVTTLGKSPSPLIVASFGRGSAPVGVGVRSNTADNREVKVTLHAWGQIQARWRWERGVGGL
jgi:hypothetical protein